MDTVQKLMDFICDLMVADVDCRNNMQIAVRNCESTGLVRNQELRQMATGGIPVVSVYSSVMRISTKKGLQKISDGEMSYSDLCCVLGIIAQDLNIRSKRNYR